MILEMNEKMLKMNEKLARTEEDLKNQLAVALIDLATTKEDLATTNDDLATTKTALMELELEVTRVKEPPYIHVCGYKDSTSIKSSTIPYSSLLYSSTNQ